MATVPSKTGLATLPSTVTAAEARQIGIPPRDLYRWRDTGQALELSRRAFGQAKAPTLAYPVFAAVTRRGLRMMASTSTAARRRSFQSCTNRSKLFGADHRSDSGSRGAR